MANDNNSVLTPKQWLMQNLQLALREFWSSITAVFATKQQVASDIATVAEIAAPLHPVNINTLTPTSTFVANAIIGINGVIYRAKQATSHFPVVLETSGGALVVQVINGKKSFVVSNPTVHATGSSGPMLPSSTGLASWQPALRRWRMRMLRSLRALLHLRQHYSLC